MMRYLLPILLLLPTVARAEVPPLPANELYAGADIIITGTVRDIQYATYQVGEVQRTYLLAKVAITTVKKGVLRSTSGWVAARGWYLNINSIPEGWAGPGGYYYEVPQGEDVPGDAHYINELQVGDRVLLYLGRRARDGTREIVYPNGWLKLP
jgi:hypothetical protein